jgi:protein SCO1
MRRRPYFALLALAATLAIGFAVAVLLNTSSRHGRAPAEAPSSANAATAFDGAALPPDLMAPDFTLTDQRGQPVQLARYRGSVTILAFLYSTCGSTCELIAQQIRGALDELPRSVPVLFVSADPAADTRASVSRFLARVSLTGRVRYLTGSASRLRPVWRGFHVVPASDGRAAFERTASVLLIDGRGRERVLFGLEQLTPESLAHDIRRLQAG